MTVHVDLPPLPTTPDSLGSEAPVAIVGNCTTLDGMMASPDDLEDFGVGFVASEAVLFYLFEQREAEIVRLAIGWKVRLWLGPEAEGLVRKRQRMLVATVGWGLCGINSLDRPMRTRPRLPDWGPRFTVADLADPQGRAVAQA